VDFGKNGWLTYLPTVQFKLGSFFKINIPQIRTKEKRLKKKKKPQKPRIKPAVSQTLAQGQQISFPSQVRSEKDW